MDTLHGAVEPDVLDQAVAWRVSLAEAGLDSSLELETWLAADAAHERAWEMVERSWDRLAAAQDEATPFELAGVRRQALQRARRDGARRWRIDARPMAAAALVICVTGAVAGGWAWRARQTESFETALGERRTVALRDGSSVVLDSGTVLKVRYTAHARTLRLESGQARFAVAHDTSRPFRVTAGDQTVLATGTNFNIDVLPSKVLVTLLQGRVTVAPRAVAAWAAWARPRTTWAPVQMTAGQQLVIAGGAEAPRLREGEAGPATAWESGLLMFNAEPLSTVAERINRYARTPVIVDDPSTAALEVSGVFKVGDVPGFVDAVTEYLPVRASSDAKGEIHLSRRAGG